MKTWITENREMGRPISDFRCVMFTMCCILAIMAVLLVSSGCEEPGTLGRYRATPVTTIILDELGVVDEEPEVYTGARDPLAEDLHSEALEYVIDVGDVVDITIYELFHSGVEWGARRQVSETGRMTLPLIGTFRATGRTELELTEDIKQMLSPQILKDPKVSVIMVGSREHVFSISGAVSTPGRFPISEVDFRISEAMAQAGGIPQYNADYAFVIRTLKPDQISNMQENASTPTSNDRSTQPDALMMEPAPIRHEDTLPDNTPVEKPIDSHLNPQEELIESVAPMSSYVTMVEMPNASDNQVNSSRKGFAGRQEESSQTLSPVDILEGVCLAANQAGDSPDKPFKIIRKDGDFELVPNDGESPMLRGPDRSSGSGDLPVEPLQTPLPPESVGSAEEIGQAGRVQEVIRIDLKALRGGDLSQNIVIRSGDEIRIPYNSVGVFYVMGQVSRPGPYSLTGNRMTLKRALATAGPLLPTAWPSRCEITRIIGKNTEVIYRVNLEKLLTGAAPDVFIKPDDVVNVGSHPVARWLAVVRQSFRYTYGFGFVYDRNFADKDMGH